MDPSLRPWDEWIATWPPLALAAFALLYVFSWQALGTCLLAPVLRLGGLPRGFSIAVSWLIFMPLVGAVGMALALFDYANPTTLCILTGVVVFFGMLSLANSWRALKRLLREETARIYALGERLLLALGLVCVVLQLLFAAHPQRLYDQLNYHLVASKRVLSFGGLTSPIYDPHLFIAGPVEYAMLWPRSLIDSDFFALAVGQSWVFAATVLPMLFAVFLLTREHARHRVVAWTLMLAVPAFIPQNELVGMLKPGAFLLSGTFLALLSPLISRRVLVAVALPFALLFTACSPTYIHASLALAFAAIIAERARPLRLLRATPLLWLSVVVFGLTLMKSITLTGTPFYPNDAKFFDTWAADAETLAYWKHIGFSRGESFVERWWGALDVPSRNLGLSIWLVCCLLAACVIVLKRDWRWRGPRLPIVFAFAFVAIWPLFYDSGAYSRFVASYVAALLAVGAAVLIHTEGRLRRALLAATAIAGLSVSHVEVMSRKIFEWNQTTVLRAFARQFPRALSSLSVNQLARPKDSVLADDAGKFFFDAAVLHGHLAPEERRIWGNLLSRPKETAMAIRLKAIVIEKIYRDDPKRPIPFAGPINEAWEGLAPHGQIAYVGKDAILYSDCYFQENPCPRVSDARWSSNIPRR